MNIRLPQLAWTAGFPIDSAIIQVGRLDYETTGCCLMTDDTYLERALTRYRKGEKVVILFLSPYKGTHMHTHTHTHIYIYIYIYIHTYM